MDWILDNIRLIVIVGGAIAYWLNQRRKAKEEAEAARTMAPAQAKTQEGEDAERTRRVQEEIRRKILERAGGATKPSAVLPPPLPAASRLSRPEQPKADAYVEPSVEEQEQTVAADQAMLLRQQQLAAKLQELQQQRRAHERPAEVFAEKTALAMSAVGTSVLGSPLADLRNPALVRRAIILREVLGTPVGLR
jgi:hypothetical protein